VATEFRTINEMTTLASVWTYDQFIDASAIEGHALGLTGVMRFLLHLTFVDGTSSSTACALQALRTLLQRCHIVDVSMLLPNVHRRGRAAVTIV
jgi:hypothetical protein